MAELPQPENQGAWKNATNTLLGNAKSVTDELFAALKDKDIVPPHSGKVVSAYVNPGPKNKADLDEKLSVTRFAANTVDTAIQRSQQCIIRLGHEQQKKWAPLKVCEWRLALRARRPTRELFKDSVQDALDKEQQALLESRVALLQLANEGKAILEDCEANKARLTRNARLMVMLGSTKLPPLTVTGESPPSPSSPSSPPPEAAAAPDGDEGGAPKSKPAVPSDPAGLVKRAPQLEEVVLRFVKKGEDAILRWRSRAVHSNEQVLVCFKKRWAENDVMKKDLHRQIIEMDEAITSAEWSLQRMKKRIDHYAEVELQPKYDAAQQILIKLRESKVTLEDDFHHKLVSMKIDECCRKITPEKTGVPPEKVPVAAMLEGPAARKKTMNKNNSSPALVGRPGSPAGVSSPLKAAGNAAMA